MPSAPFVRAMVVVPLTVRLGDPPPVRVTFVLVMIGLGLGLCRRAARSPCRRGPRSRAGRKQEALSRMMQPENWHDASPPSVTQH